MFILESNGPEEEYKDLFNKAIAKVENILWGWIFLKTYGICFVTEYNIWCVSDTGTDNKGWNCG